MTQTVDFNLYVATLFNSKMNEIKCPKNNKKHGKFIAYNPKKPIIILHIKTFVVNKIK